MANTYYDSQLTAAEIEAALEAIDGVIVPANNGKVLAINNGKIEARSVQWGGGGSAVLEPLSVTANGDYTPEAGIDGFDEVHVSVPNSYTASDEGKVVNNGALVAQTARASQITQNGTYNTTLNNEVTVNVSGGGSAVVQPLSVTQNGTYNPPSGVDGYAPVMVSVPSGGSSGVYVGTSEPSQSEGENGNYYYQRTNGKNWIIDNAASNGTNTKIYGVEFVPVKDIVVKSLTGICRINRTGSIRIGTLTNILETVENITFNAKEWALAELSQPIALQKDVHYIIQVVIDNDLSGSGNIGYVQYGNGVFDTNIATRVQARYGSWPGSVEQTDPAVGFIYEVPYYLVKKEFLKQGGAWIQIG